MEVLENIEAFCPISREKWRKWLENNHKAKKRIWLINYKKKSKFLTLAYSEAVN
jgi:uncharacterized protein YdeI (YjbR/CyaY-like superfamily)